MIAAGVIGWPVAHSKSPLIHRFWLAKLRIDGDYGRFAVAPADLGDAIRALPKLGLRGVNITVPHKVAAIAHVDRVDPLAARVGALNTIVVEADGTLTGWNTDVAGVATALSGVDLASASVVVIGAGGAARAALAALAEAGTSHPTVAARDPSRAADLLRSFDIAGTAAPFDQLAPAVAAADLVINASPLGMAGQPPLDAAVLAAVRCPRTRSTVFDMVYVPLETPLLAAARVGGRTAIDGLQMLVGQAAAAFELFYGAPAPREHDAALRALLTA